MEEPYPINGPSGVLPGTGKEVNAMDSLDLRLKLLQGCLMAVKKMPSPNFNEQQCGYLVDKLEVVVQVARSFLEVSSGNDCGPDSSWNATKWVGIFKLLFALGKRIEDFIAECSKFPWVEAAMALSNVAEYVSSLGFNLELCKALFLEGQCAAMQQGLTLFDVDTLNKAEVEMVRLKAVKDKEYLLKKVTLELDSSNLAKYLLRRLLSVHPTPFCDEGNIFGKLFAWLKSDMRARQLGKGASASVYEAMWLGIPVAQKIFFGVENGFFLREVEILSQLCHPNITSMFASTMNRGNCTIIMELMDVDLFMLIQTRCEEKSDSPPFSISVSLDLMHQIAEGVNYLHTKRIIHRDLKSRNILVKMVRAAELDTWYLQAKVVDFGLSKTKEMSATNSCMTYNQGTDRWMAPELVRLVEDDPDFVASNEVVLNYKFKCDVYSFAMVCYEILTGEVPFKDESKSRVIKQLVLKGVRPTLPTNCPTMLKALIEKCWDGTPKARPTFGTICLTLQYLKYMLMRGDITPGGLEARLDNIISDGSECLEVDDVLPTIIVPLVANCHQDFCTFETFKIALPTFPTMEELETMNDPTGLFPKTEEGNAHSIQPNIQSFFVLLIELSRVQIYLPSKANILEMRKVICLVICLVINPADDYSLLFIYTPVLNPTTFDRICAAVNAMESLDFCLKLLQGCLMAVKKMPSPNFNEQQCGYLVDKLEVVVQVARSFLEVSSGNDCGPDSSWNATKWVGIFKLLLASGKQIEDFIAQCSIAAWMEAAMKLIDVAEYVSSLGFHLELCKALFLEGQCAPMQQGLTLFDVDTLNRAEVELVRLKAVKDKGYLLEKVTLASDASNLAKYLLQRLSTGKLEDVSSSKGNILGILFDWVAPELVKLYVDYGESVAQSEAVLNYNFKCDVYSFAILCFEILTGKLPFEDQWMGTKIRQLVVEGVRPTLPTNCPTMLKALIEKCWDGTPKERPAFGTICSTLQYLKYLLLRGDITPEG